MPINSIKNHLSPPSNPSSPNNQSNRSSPSIPSGLPTCWFPLSNVLNPWSQRVEKAWGTGGQSHELYQSVSTISSNCTSSLHFQSRDSRFAARFSPNEKKGWKKDENPKRPHVRKVKGKVSEWGIFACLFEVFSAVFWGSAKWTTFAGWIPKKMWRGPLAR